jgi:tetratricopeptide (TPR) repeat protein
MKKVSFILFFALLLGMQFVSAQGDPNSKVVTGVIAYEGNRYDEAILKLTEALGKSDLLKPKNVPKTHYFLMQSYIRVSGGDAALKAKFPDAEDKACESLIKLKETKNMATGADLKTYENGIALAEQQLWTAIFNKGVEVYGNANYSDALKYSSRANQLAPDNYMSPFMLGFAQIMMKDSMAAKTTWEKCIDLYAKTQIGDKSKIDTNMVNVYLNLANIYTVKEGNVKALKIVQEGLTRFPKDPNLEITELSIYQRDPSLLKEALTKFEEATKKNPNDEKIFVAYASLLEKAGREKDALGVYEQVLQKSPDNLYANLNSGAYYVNKAAAVKKEMDAAGDNEKLYKEKYEEVKGNLAKAYPFMVKVHQKEPTNIEWVSQLVSITSYLMLDGKEMEEAFNKYVKLQTEMRKK